MSFTLKASSGGGGGTEKAPVGNHLAVLVGIFDMGKQRNTFGEETKVQPRAYFVWELVGEQISGTTKNHVIGIDLTMSLNEKAKLRLWLEARTGKKITEGAEFDITKELGQPCMLNVIANKGGYPTIASVAAVPAAFLKSMPPATYPLTAMTLAQFAAGEPIPEWVPWLYGNELGDHIRASVEMGGQKPKPKAKAEAGAAGVPNSPNGIATGTNDPVPF